MKLIKESDIDYILAPIAPVLKGEKVHYEWIAFRKQIDELQGISPLANRSIFRYVFADETSIELLDVGLSEESKEKLEEIHGKANVEKINPSIPGKKMPLICLRCKKPILLPMSTVVVSSYTHYSYCEDCLRKGLKLLKAQDEAQADGEYILKSDAIRVASGYCHPSNVAKEIEKLPAVRPNVGYWKKISPADIYECSECGQNVMTKDICAYHFCHGCGAHMH